MEDYLKEIEMRLVVKDGKLKWRELKSGVAQGSVLATIMYLVFPNVMAEGVSRYR